MLDLIYMGSADPSKWGGSEKFRIKIYVSNRIRSQATPLQDRKVSALDRSVTPRPFGYRLTVYTDIWKHIDMWQYLYEIGYGLIPLRH